VGQLLTLIDTTPIIITLLSLLRVVAPVINGFTEMKPLMSPYKDRNTQLTYMRNYQREQRRLFKMLLEKAEFLKNVVFRETPCKRCGSKKVATDPQGVHADYCLDCGLVDIEKGQTKNG